MLEIGIVSDGVLYYFEKVSWISIERTSAVKMMTEDNTILIMEEKNDAEDGK